MRMMGEYLVAMLSFLEQAKQHELCIVECGTIRNPSFGHEDGLSTYHITKWLKENAEFAHQFYSFEISPSAIYECQKFLKIAGLDSKVQFGLGDAAMLLRHFNKPIDFCYLDAGEDAVQNLMQFRQAQKWMDNPAMIVIDDVFDSRNADRGLVTVPFARLEGYRVAKVAGRMAAIAFGDAAAEFLKGWDEACCLN